MTKSHMFHALTPTMISDAGTINSRMMEINQFSWDTDYSFY